MSAALSQILTIFLAILAGFVCRKARVLTEENTSALSNIVVKIILPFYLFGAILRTDAGVDPRAVPIAVGLSAAMFLLSALVALAVVPLLRPPKEDRGVYLFELMCGNVTYIGIPVCAAVLGGSASFYASLLNIPYNLICFSLGIFLLCGKFSLRKALNPAFLAGLAAAILYMLRVQLPPVLLSGCAFLGQATSPCAMLVIGSVLASVPIRRLSASGARSPSCCCALSASRPSPRSCSVSCRSIRRSRACSSSWPPCPPRPTPPCSAPSTAETAPSRPS